MNDQNRKRKKHLRRKSRTTKKIEESRKRSNEKSTTFLSSTEFQRSKKSEGKSGNVLRSFGILRSEIDDNLRSVDVSFSSESPVSDNFFGPPVILLHEDEAVNLEPLREVGSALINHDTDLESIIGSITDVRIDPESRVCRARITFDNDKRSELAFQKVKSGSLRGVSVRFSIGTSVRVEEEKEYISPAGRAFRGPVEVATNWTPREVSLTPIPADVGVGVGREENFQQKDLETMKAEIADRLKARGLSPENFGSEEIAVKLLSQLEESDELLRANSAERQVKNTLEIDAKREANGVSQNPLVVESQKKDCEKSIEDGVRKLEMERLRGLKEVAEQAGIERKTVEWFEGGLTVDQARKEALAYLAKNNPTPGAVVVEVEAEAGEKVREMLSASYMNSSGQRYEMPKRFKDLDTYDGIGLLDGARHCLKSVGVDTWGLRSHEVFQRAFSHGSGYFSGVLENIIDKSMANGFNDSPVTYSEWTQRRDVADFKQISRPNLGEIEVFTETPDLMPVAESDVRDKSEKNQLRTYAKKFSLGRQAFLNDDAGAFIRIASMFGAAGSATINQAVYDHIVSGTGNNGPTMTEDSLQLFSNTHTSGDNFRASATGALTQANLAAAKTLMRLQSGITAAATGGNRPLNLTPRHLLVPANLENEALQLVEGNFVPTAATGTSTSDQRNLNVVVEAYLDAVAGNNTDWYLIADTSLVDTVEVARLRGQTGPVMERINGHDILGFSWVGYVDFGVQAVEHRGMVKSEA